MYVARCTVVSRHTQAPSLVEPHMKKKKDITFIPTGYSHPANDIGTSYNLNTGATVNLVYITAIMRLDRLSVCKHELLSRTCVMFTWVQGTQKVLQAIKLPARLHEYVGKCTVHCSTEQ